MADGLTSDKTTYTKGETITLTFTDSTRAAVPAVPDQHDPLTFSDTLASNQVVNLTVDVVTVGSPAIPAKPANTPTATGGHTVAPVAGSDTGTVTKYTTVA